jgi:fructokinase
MKYCIAGFGEILFDIYPGYKCMGGAPFNFAFHLHQFGHEVAFISRVGKDDNGMEIKGFMEQYSMNTDFLETDPCNKTGEVRVCLDSKGIPAFTIEKNTAYDFIQPGKALLAPFLSGVHLFYFGTLAQRHPVSRETLYRILHYLPGEALIFFDINLRQDFFSREIIEKSLSACHVLKANDDELDCLKEMFHIQDNEFNAVLKLIARFNLYCVCVTKGSKGASLYFKDKQYHVGESTGPGDAVIDTVGAGDGFAAGLAMGLLTQTSPGKIIARADTFARRLCRIKGALPLESSFYRSFSPWYES